MDLARQCVAQGYDFVAIGAHLSAMLAGSRLDSSAVGTESPSSPQAPNS